MPDFLDFLDFKEFCLWYESIGLEEPFDLHEAATIYYNLENYFYV